jgi:hypothetical protein
MSWVTLTNYGQYEAYIEGMKVFEILGQVASKSKDLDLIDLISGPIYCYFNAKLSFVSEGMLPQFIAKLKSHLLFYQVLIDELKTNKETKLLGDSFNPADYKNALAAANLLEDVVSSFVRCLDPKLEIFNKTPYIVGQFFFPTFIRLYIELKKVPVLTSTATEAIFAQHGAMFEGSNEINRKIKAGFYAKLSAIRRKMDSEFKDIQEDKDDMIIKNEPAVEAGSVTQGKIEPLSSKCPESSETNSNSVAEPVTAPLTQDVTEMKPKLNNEFLSRKALASQKKEAKLKRRSEIAKLRHAKRISELKPGVNEDEDVAFYFAATNKEANDVYLKNSAEKVNRKYYPFSKRYQHSFYPNVSASGKTIHILFKLMIGGAPTYEEFCEAHKDLGGVRREAKNGNKQFYFEAPISYRKSFHRPHDSSDFSRVLARKFYRNCGLHPFFFILDN